MESTGRSNESISAEGMVILSKYRKLIYPKEDNVFKKDSNILIKLLQTSKDWIVQTKPKLSPEVEIYIRQKHQKEIDALKNIYGVNLGHLKSIYPKNSKPSVREIDGSCVEKVLYDFDINVLINWLLYIVKFQLNQKS
ncbi:MAG: hypothetical protein ABWU14_21685 [Limnospira maxima]|uniref:hypothetical protein n=1 Tax=Limnospira sp. PMC 1281.21 TaxID=2981064 RepID=UPI0028E1793A|nr:hypothetical protein [Limnospira sp. PMC 1281.21]MDT9302655.1 hypothetical protein [Limnospira sp. PMC 1281.21]